MQFEKTYTCIENENQTNATLARGINTTVQSGNRLECVRNHMLCEIAIRNLSARPSGEQARIYIVLHAYNPKTASWMPPRIM